MSMSMHVSIAYFDHSSPCFVLSFRSPTLICVSSWVKAHMGVEAFWPKSLTGEQPASHRWWRDRYTQGKESLAAMEQLLTSLAEGQAAAPPADSTNAGTAAALTSEPFAPGALPAGWADRSTHPLQPELPSPSWVQAIFNTIWLVSRLTALETPAERRKMLTSLAPSAPFQMPLMVVVPYDTLRNLGRLPKRDTSKSAEENGWQVSSADSCSAPFVAHLSFLADILVVLHLLRPLPGAHPSPDVA